MADTMGTKEAAEKWGYKPATISGAEKRKFLVYLKMLKGVLGIFQKMLNVPNR